ncbi:MAG: hypothetical protein ABIN91_07060 [Mucilaginibacter sp.]|uniref:hypothetical protein n=1 Tax=Mucilaginibacter sp. TaxID=1882438 RepID=UPI003266AA0D
MKKSKAITLVLVTGLLGCSHNKPEHNRLYMRTDSTGNYTHATTGYHGYYVFHAFGTYYPGAYYGNGYGGYYGGAYGGRSGYIRQGYSNSGVHSSEGGGVSRGGFGSSGGFHASSSS